MTPTPEQQRAEELMARGPVWLVRRVMDLEWVLETVEPLIDAQFEGHADIEEFMEKARKLNVALDTVRAALSYPGAALSAQSEGSET